MDDDRYTRITLRIPKVLQEALAREAFATSKSQNAEIIARLEGSFAVGIGALPPAVQAAIEDDIQAHGGTPAEALTRLVLAGQTHGGTVLNITLAGDTPLSKLVEMLAAAEHAIPSDASVIMRRG